MINEDFSFNSQQIVSIVSAVSGILITIMVNVIREYFKKSKQKDALDLIISQKKEQESNKNFNDQINFIVEANTSYRDEIRKDLENLKKEMQLLTLHYEVKMDLMKNDYEKEIKELKKQIEEMGTMLVEYRKENSMLHRILKEENIQIPDWAVVKGKVPEEGGKC
jgi:hypothetical protein